MFYSRYDSIYVNFAIKHFSVWSCITINYSNMSHELRHLLNNFANALDNGNLRLILTIYMNLFRIFGQKIELLTNFTKFAR